MNYQITVGTGGGGAGGGNSELWRAPVEFTGLNLRERCLALYPHMEDGTCFAITRACLDDLGVKKLEEAAHQVPGAFFTVQVFVDFTTDNLLVVRGAWPEGVPKPGKLVRIVT